MSSVSSFRWINLLGFLLVVFLAAGTRCWYVHECLADGTSQVLPFLAQAETQYSTIPKGTKFLGKKNPTELDNLVHNIHHDNWFGSFAPLSKEEEHTAHIAPGYPWAVAMMYRFVPEQQAEPLIRWVQCGLGALTAGLYFVFARMAFGNFLVALLTGLLCAFHPLWIINAGQVSDGVLTSLLLAFVLILGMRATRKEDVFCSLLFGLALAILALVRASLFPFTVVSLLWFVWKSRSMERGWFIALLALLGFLNGVAPWMVRNYQTFGEFLPVVDSAWLHIWMGNNRGATGAEMESGDVAIALGPERTMELQAESNQPQRYKMLTDDVAEFVSANPDKAIKNRIWAGLYFFLGKDWFDENANPGQDTSASAKVPDWLNQSYPVILNGVLLGILLLGLLGWRWTHGWSNHTGLATLALMWVPLPYLLSHAETLWGPRLPLDGLLLCFSAFALVYLIPGLRGNLGNGPETGGLREI